MISLLAQTGLSPFLSWLLTAGVVILVIVGGILALFSQFFRKVGPEEAIVRSGAGGLKAKTGGLCSAFYSATMFDNDVLCSAFRR
jgi:uncharacterized membrane protein YqiK